MADIVSNLSRGNFVRYQGELVKIEELEHRTPGNLRAFYQVKMRNVYTGKILENRFRPSETIEKLHVETKEYQYLYKDGEQLVCMDNLTFDQIEIPQNLLGEALKYIKEEVILTIVFENGNIPILVSPPLHTVLSVTYTEPGLSGDTATHSLKTAIMENDTKIKVPLFINIGDRIKINTSSGEYIERVK